MEKERNLKGGEKSNQYKELKEHVHVHVHGHLYHSSCKDQSTAR